jgi:hypothetical protein
MGVVGYHPGYRESRFRVRFQRGDQQRAVFRAQSVVIVAVGDVLACCGFDPVDPRPVAVVFLFVGDVVVHLVVRKVPPPGQPRLAELPAEYLVGPVGDHDVFHSRVCLGLHSGDAPAEEQFMPAPRRGDH